MKPSNTGQIEKGQLLNGRYQILEKLGSGAHSSVYKVADKQMSDEIVCVKLLNHHLAFCERNQERFRGEVRILENIMHENVVRTFDCGTTEAGVPFIVMEYVQGGDLGQHIEDSGCFSAEEAVRTLHSLLKALALVHEHGIIHRDLKPSNVMLDDDGVVKLIDFGVAKEVDTNFELTRSGDSVGSPLYMSPEQLCNKEVGASSDLYALGLIGFELLGGESFHTGASPYAVSVQQNGDYLASRLAMLAQKGVSESLISFIERCCQADPAARYSSATEAMGDLYRNTSNVKKRRRTSIVQRQSKVKLILLGVGLFVAFAVFVGFVIGDNRVQTWFIGHVLRAEEFTENHLGFDLSFIKVPLRYDNLRLTPEIFEKIVRGTPGVTRKRSDEAYTLFIRHAFGEDKIIKPSFRTSDGRSPLFYMLQQGRARFVEAFVKDDVPICGMEKLLDVPVYDCESDRGIKSGELTLLQIAAYYNNSAFVTLFSEGLKECGIDWINHRTSVCGVSALGFYIISSGNESGLRKALALVDPRELQTEIGKGEHRSTLLHHAVVNGNVFALEPLIEHFPHLVNAQDANGDTPLHRADMTGNQLFFERLLIFGADPRIKNNEGVETSAFAALIIANKLWTEHAGQWIKLE